MRELGDAAPFAQHEDPIRAFEHFLEFGGNHQHAEPVLGELLDDALDLRLGADVDAARRLVEDQQLRVHREPAREQHLLLVAAGELADRLIGPGAFDAEPLR